VFVLEKVDYGEDLDPVLSVCKFIEFFYSSKPVLLLEIGSISSFKEEAIRRLQSLFGYFQHAQLVVSHSCEGTSAVENSRLRRMIRVLSHSLKKVELRPFTKQEAEVFIRTYPNDLKLGLDEYKGLTNYNPSLLNQCRAFDRFLAAASEMDIKCREFVDEVKQHLKSDEFERISTTLPLY
jgi:hypothetical protein